MRCARTCARHIQEGSLDQFVKDRCPHLAAARQFHACHAANELRFHPNTLAAALDDRFGAAMCPQKCVEPLPHGRVEARADAADITELSSYFVRKNELA